MRLLAPVGVAALFVASCGSDGEPAAVDGAPVDEVVEDPAEVRDLVEFPGKEPVEAVRNPRYHHHGDRGRGASPVEQEQHERQQEEARYAEDIGDGHDARGAVLVACSRRVSHACLPSIRASRARGRGSPW